MTAAENIFDNFKFTMSGLEKGLQVTHITTPAAQLLCCECDEDIEAVLALPDLEPFDQIPVKQQGIIIGLLMRRKCSAGVKGHVRDHMQPLKEEILVSSDTPLLKFIQNDSLNRIVISGSKIYGLVTRSDFLKLPVFLLGFALVTHVEALMLNMIRDTGISANEWLLLLPSRRRSDIKNRFEGLTIQRSEPDKLELTYFSDKSDILQKLIDCEKYASHLPDKEFISQLPEITYLRNSIVHSGNNHDNNDNLQKFIDRLYIADKWINRIEQWQTAHTNITH